MIHKRLVDSQLSTFSLSFFDKEKLLNKLYFKTLQITRRK